MQIRCTNCGTQFKLDDKRVPSSGARAKCSICSTMVAVPPPSAVAPDDPVFFAHTGPTRSADEAFRDAPGKAGDEQAVDLEQRDVMWHITQELFRIRESLDKQSSALAALIDRGSSSRSEPDANGNLEGRIIELTAALREAREEIDRLQKESRTRSEEAIPKKVGPFGRLFRRRF